MKLILTLLILSIFNYCVYSQQFSKFHITGPGCNTNGENINLNQCVKSICGGAGSNIEFNTQSNYTISLYYDNLCTTASDSIEFECPNDETSTEIGSYFVSCHDNTWVPENYHEFTIFGDGCNSEGESLPLSNCTLVCGSYTAVRKNIETGEYTILLAYDQYCTEITDQMDFACLSDNQAAKIGDYGIICSDPTSASSSSSQEYSSSSVEAQYTSFTVFGQDCPSTGDHLTIYQCDSFCGGFGQFSLNDTYSDTYNIALSTDSNCNYVTDEAQIICLPDNQYVQIGDYYVVCNN